MLHSSEDDSDWLLLLLVIFREQPHDSLLRLAEVAFVTIRLDDEDPRI